MVQEILKFDPSDLKIKHYLAKSVILPSIQNLKDNTPLISKILENKSKEIIPEFLKNDVE